MKLTNEKLFAYANKRVDESARPYMKRALFAGLYNESRLEWMRLKHKDYEASEAVRRDLAPFDRHFLVGDVRSFYFKDLPVANSHRFITAIHADFTLSCNNVSTTYTLPIKPLTKDVAFAAMTDPFEQPDDTEPCYIESADSAGEFIKVLSTSVPKSLTVHYLKYPVPMTATPWDPDGLTEETEAAQLEILDLVLEKYFKGVENFNSAAGQREEIIQSGI